MPHSIFCRGIWTQGPNSMYLALHKWAECGIGTITTIVKSLRGPLSLVRRLLVPVLVRLFSFFI